MSTTQLFEGLTDDYHAFRPSYPAAALEWLKALAGTVVRMLDVGADRAGLGLTLLRDGVFLREIEPCRPSPPLKSAASYGNAR